MLKLLKTILPWLLVPAFFVIGLQLGPRLAGWYHATCPPPVVLYATSACPYCAYARYAEMCP